jgi:hypothetical protein
VVKPRTSDGQTASLGLCQFYPKSVVNRVQSWCLKLMVLFGLVYFQPSENVSFFKILHTCADGKIDEDTQRARVIDKNRILMYYSDKIN